MLGVFATRKFAALEMSTRFWAHWEGWRLASHLLRGHYYPFMLELQQINSGAEY